MFKKNDQVKWLWVYDAVVISAQYDKYNGRQMYLIKLTDSGRLYVAFENDLKLID